MPKTKKTNDEIKKDEEFDIDEAFARLEEINEKLADRDTKLKDAIKLYAEGTILADRCKNHLEGVEKEIRILGEDEGTDL